MGQLHSTNCLLMRNVRVAVADTSKSALLKAKRMGIKELYNDFHELLQKANADAVVITLPNFLHTETACLAAEKSLDIFVEKPLARTAEECRTIIKCAQNSGAKLMVGFYQRFLERNLALKHAIDQGELGTVELVAYEIVSGGPFSHRFPPSPVPEWWFDVGKVGGGALLDTGTHMIDLLRWLLSDEMSVQYVFLGHKLRLPMEDTAILSLRFDREAMAVLMTSWLSAAAHPTSRMDVHGRAKSVSLGDFPTTHSIKHIASVMSKNLVHRFLGRILEPYSLYEAPRAYYKELQHFVDCVREDKEPSVTGQDGLECAKVIDMAYQLGANGCSSNNSHAR